MIPKRCEQSIGVHNVFADLRHRGLLLRLVSLLSLICVFPSLGFSADKWWNKNWKYRLEVGVVEKERRGGINTVRAELREQSSLCAKDGRDVRVLDASGQILPHNVEKFQDGSLSVLFFVPPDREKFFIYYGNKKAPRVSHQWDRHLGGLTLETRLLQNGVFRNLAHLDYLLGADLEKCGKKEWRHINDLENPFGRNDYYLSIYEGTIYLPETGQYTFALNADDFASFDLQLGEEELLHCERKVGVPSESWRDPTHPKAVRTTAEPIKRGVYRLHYYHVENGGAQLAKLGWQGPSSDAIVTVPPRAFVKFLPAEIKGREVLGADLNPFFISRHRYNLHVNGDELKFPRHHFESRSGEPPESESRFTYQWDFGDGTTATGRTTDHEFPRQKPYRVTLTIRNKKGKQARIKRRVTHAPEPVKQMNLRMQIAFESEFPILPAGEKAKIKLYLKNKSNLKRDVVLETVSKTNSGVKIKSRRDKRLIEELRPSPGLQGGWLPIETSAALPKGDLYLTFRLLLHGRSTTEKTLAALSTDRPLMRLKQDRAHNLRDRQGRLVVLRIADAKIKNVPQRQIFSPKNGVCRILVLDSGLSGPSGASPKRPSYITMLTNALRNTYNPLRFEVKKPQLKSGEEFPPTRRFLEMQQSISESGPHLIILVGQPESVVNTVPHEAFEAYLIAALDQALSQSRAYIILITPPPLPLRPKLSHHYARIIKKTGLRKGLPVADIYSRFMLEEKWERLFRPSPENKSSYQLHPNEEGQKIIHRGIFTTIARKFHSELSAASRRISMKKGR
ncbi:MAG: PKD domain-containing protein [Candidatus Brocadiia bacterium]